MNTATNRTMTSSRLGLLLMVLFVLLLAPAILLAWLGYRQLQFEAFYLHQSMASEIADRIDREAGRLFEAEDALAAADFEFLIVGEGDYLQRSPLSTFPVRGTLPGLLTYFQVDAAGIFSTPLLPVDAERPQDEELKRWSDRGRDLPATEYEARRAMENRARTLLAGSAAEPEVAEAMDAVPDSRKDAADEDDAAPGPRRKMAAAETPRATLVGSSEEAAVVAEEALADQSVGASGRAAPAAITEVRQQQVLKEGQRAYERLNAPVARADVPVPGSLGNVAELKLEKRFDQPADVADKGLLTGAKAFPDAAAPQAVDTDSLSSVLEKEVQEAEPVVESRRLEKSLATEQVEDDGRLRLVMFENEVGSFRIDRLDADHFVLYRDVWRDRQRLVQGAILDRAEFIQGLVGERFRRSQLDGISDLVVAFEDEVLQSYRPLNLGGGRLTSSSGYGFRASDITGTLLFQTRLSQPLNELALIFGFTELPQGPGGRLIGWTLLVYVLLLGGGLGLLFRLGNRQLALAAQQRDFVSAVSHELKSPLTSIRMYGEILKAGWADEAKKREYYDFIFTESERLSRLINNVLRLARFDHGGDTLDLKPMGAAELADLTTSKIASQVEQAGFELEVQHASPEAQVRVDAAAFSQIMINLVDNALKFSAASTESDADSESTRKIRISSRVRDERWLEFAVRDFGPGVPRDQMKKIFSLFYRTERELTRETVGTGIGLALVAELAAAQGGSVDVVNADPGAEFRVRLPLTEL